jgi:hypothetical protein
MLYPVTAGWLIVTAIQLSAQQPSNAGAERPITVARATPAQVSMAKILPGTRADVFGTIQGHALNSVGSGLPKAILRLRDVRMGAIVEMQMSDSAGAFRFLSIDPGAYVVEILGDNRRSVLAASDILTVNPSQMILTSVQLPRHALAAGMGFGALTSSAGTVATMAASSGVLAAQIAGAPTCPGPTN